MLGSSRSYSSCHSLVEACVILRSLLSAAALVLGAPALRGFEPCAFRRGPINDLVLNVVAEGHPVVARRVEEPVRRGLGPEKCMIFTYT